MAISFGMFLRLFVFFAVTTCSKLQCLPLLTRIVEKNEEALSAPVMAEELQLEISSHIYAADWSSLERIAQFLKAEYERKDETCGGKTCHSATEGRDWQIRSNQSRAVS